MRLILILPDIEPIQSQIEAMKKRYAKLPWLEAPDTIEKLAELLLSDDLKQGYVISGFSKDPEAPQQLHALLKEKQGKKVQLPLYLHWNGKPKKDQREVVQAFRDEIKQQAQYIYTHRRLVSFAKVKKMGKAFAEAKKRSKPGRMIRLGVSVAAAIFLAVVLVTVLFFRDAIMRPILVSTIQDQTGAKVEMETFASGLSDLSLDIQQFAAADAEAPMQNLVSFDRLQTSWDLGPLLSGKLHAQTLELRGLGFQTLRSESGALPIEPVATTAQENTAAMLEDAQQTDATVEEDDFVTTLNNTMGDFEPPKKEDLESTQVLERYQQEAEAHQQSLQTQLDAIDVQKALAASREAAQQLKGVALLDVDNSKTQAALDKNKTELEAVQVAVAADVALVQKDVEALKDFKVDLKDLKKAEAQIAQTKDLKDRIDAIKSQINKGKALADDSRAQVQQQTEAIKRQTAAARKQFQEQLAAVQAPLVEAQKQIQSVQADAKKAATEMQQAKPDFHAALARDKQKVKEQYSVDGIRDASKMLMEELIGFEFFDKLENALLWYNRIKPWLPVSEKSSKPKPAVPGKGRNYDFPTTAEDGGLAGVYIQEMSLDGVFPLQDGEMAFVGNVQDLSSNLAYTQKPVHLQLHSADQQSAQQLEADLRLDLDSIIRGTCMVKGLQWSSAGRQSGKAAGIMPGPMRSDSVEVRVQQLELGDKKLDGIIHIYLSELSIGAPSGADVHPEIHAAFASVYAGLSELHIEIGLGAQRSFKTEPDVGQMLGEALEQRIAAKLEAAQQQAEKEIRAQGEAQLQALDAVGADLANPEALQAKQAELSKAFESIDALGAAEDKRLAAEEANLLQGLDQFNQAIKQQDELVAQQNAEMDKLTERIEKEKKRIQKDMLGGGLKKLIPKF